MQFTPEQQRKRLRDHLAQKDGSLRTAQEIVRAGRNQRTQNNVQHARRSFENAQRMLNKHLSDFPDLKE